MESMFAWKVRLARLLRHVRKIPRRRGLGAAAAEAEEEAAAPLFVAVAAAVDGWVEDKKTDADDCGGAEDDEGMDEGGFGFLRDLRNLSNSWTVGIAGRGGG